jgi:hypothetical protein
MAKIDPKIVNIWTARVIPFVLMGVVGYTTYVTVARLCGECFLLCPFLSRTAGEGQSLMVAA